MLPLADIVRNPSAPLEEVALAIAADEYPELDRPRLRARLDELGARAAERLGRERGEQARLDRLCECVYGELGFGGNEDYDDPRNNYLNDVVERHKASPVLMAVVLIALGRRASLPLEAIGFPGHFLVGAGTSQRVFVDPFDGARPLDPDRLCALAREALSVGAREAAERLQPVGARTVAVRILQNLQRIYRQRSDHARSLVVCTRLFELTDAPFHQCDRGVHALAMGAVRLGIEDLEAYLSAHPRAPDADEVRRVLARARRIELSTPS